MRDDRRCQNRSWLLKEVLGSRHFRQAVVSCPFKYFRYKQVVKLRSDPLESSDSFKFQELKYKCPDVIKDRRFHKLYLLYNRGLNLSRL